MLYKLKELHRAVKGSFGNDEELIYVGRFREGEKRNELVDEAEKRGMIGDFHTMPILPDDLYLTEKAFKKFNSFKEQELLTEII